MDAAVTAELEALEKLGLEAVRNSRVPADVRARLVANVAGALATLLHLGLITPEEDAEWRERLQPVFGEGLRVTRWRIAKDPAAEAAPPAPEAEATHAYAMCRNLTLTELAWSLHTGANEEAVTAALTADAIDAERIARACRRGFDDRRLSVTSQPDL
jgi:hypothetical protein